MPTVRFFIQSKKSNTPVYCRLSVGRGTDLKRKTGFTVDSSNWNKINGRAKGRNAQGKSLNHRLAKLDEYILNSFNEAQSIGKRIDGRWLETVISDSFNRSSEDTRSDLIEYSNTFLENLDYRKNDNNGQSLSVASRVKYRTIVNKLKAFENFKKRNYKLKDVGIQFHREFMRYLQEEEGISRGTVGRYLRTVKTILIDARKNGLEVSPELEHFKGFTEKTYKHILTFKELNILSKLQLEGDRDCAARDWLIIACYTGQRISDFIRMNSKMIKEIEGFKFIELTQTKSGKLVQIPIKKEVEIILESYNGEFPPTFGKIGGSAEAQFNLRIKRICRLASINEITEGSLNNPVTGFYEKGQYEKWKLVSSHIGRRSFATNFYGEISTPLLMNITAHSTERQFLEYIGKKPIDYSLQLAKIWQENDS
jgi:hypothetical protein